MDDKKAVLLGCLAVPVILLLGVGIYGLIAFVIVKAIKAAL